VLTVWKALAVLPQSNLPYEAQLYHQPTKSKPLHDCYKWLVYSSFIIFV